MKTIKKHAFSLLIFMTVFCVNVNAQNNFDYIGLEHNKKLQAILQSFDNSTTSKNAFYKAQTVAGKEYPGKTTEQLGLYEYADFTDPIKMLDELVTKKKMNNQLYHVCKEDINAILLKGKAEDISEYADARNNKAENLVSSKDLVAYRAFLSTLKHSAIFWNPEGNNGIKYLNKRGISSNDKYSIYYKENVKSSAVYINWWKVAGCDAAGAIGGALMGGIPSGGVGAVPGAIIGGCVSSACSIIMMW